LKEARKVLATLNAENEKEEKLREKEKEEKRKERTLKKRAANAEKKMTLNQRQIKQRIQMKTK